MTKICVKCEKPINLEVEQNIPCCHNCRMEFKNFDKLVAFLMKMPQDHPERKWFIHSQISDRQSYAMSCKNKTPIRTTMEFEIQNLYRIQEGMAVIVEEQLRIVETPILQTEPLVIVETPNFQIVATP